MIAPWMEHDRRLLIERVVPGVIHEINNLNQTILLSTQILREVWRDLKPMSERYFEEQGEYTVGGMPYSAIRGELDGYIGDAVDSSDRIRLMMIDLRRLVRRLPEDSHESLELNSLIRSTASLLAHFMRNATDRFTVDLSPALPPVTGSHPAVQQALLHLLMYCAQALGSRTQEVRVATGMEGSGDNVYLHVSHGGTGVSAAALGKLSEKLSSPADPGANGCEQGDELCLALWILREQGAEIDLSAVQGERFRISVRFRIQKG